jgi:heptosyltransferase-3
LNRFARTDFLFFRRMPSSRDSSPSVLLIRRRYLGDLVQLGTVLRNLRLHWPTARLTVLTERAYAGVFAMNPDADAVLPFPRNLADWWKLWRQLRAAHFTLVLDFDNRDKTALLTRLTGAANRYALHHGSPAHLGWLYTGQEIIPVKFFDDHHIIDFYHRLAIRAGVPIANRDVTLHPLPADLVFVRSLPELAGLPTDRPRVLVHPGSRSAFRVWPAENFAAVCDRLQADKLASVTLVAGPGDAPLIDAIQRAIRTPVVCLRQTFSVPQLGALFASFDLLLCHDSGPMHVAAAVGTRVVALFGSQSPQVFGPTGSGHIMLSPPLPCKNCVAPDVCQRDDAYHNYCVRNITTDKVYTAVAGVCRAKSAQ